MYPLGQSSPRSAISLTCVPGATSDDLDTLWVRGRTLRIGYDSAWVWTVPILTPFQDIPLHIVQSPRIRRLLPDRMRPKAAVERIPGVVGQVREIGIIAVAEPCRLRPEFHDPWAGPCLNRSDCRGIQRARSRSPRRGSVSS